jgi:hypothetical protein
MINLNAFFITLYLAMAIVMAMLIGNPWLGRIQYMVLGITIA